MARRARAPRLTLAASQEFFRTKDDERPAIPVKCNCGLVEFSAEMSSKKKALRTARKPLDKFSGKGRRGRRGAPRAEILGRAEHLRLLLEKCWDQIGDDLLRALNKEDVIQAFERTNEYHRRFFVPHLAPLILKILTEKKFPKTRTARIGFLSDSLGAEGAVSARRSRDICQSVRMP